MDNDNDDDNDNNDNDNETKTKAGTTTIKYQTMMHHIMIIMSMMAIWRITIKMIMTPQETGMMTSKMRNIKMVMLMNLRVMVKI